MNHSIEKPLEIITSKILIIRDQRVMIDADLAELYDVPTKRFNEQIKRNIDRFPEDFMFQLTNHEFSSLRSQNATSRLQHGGRRHNPRVFTEHGAIMAATVLNSSRAVEVSVYVVRAFVMLRNTLAAHQELKIRLDELECKIASRFSEQDELIHDVVLTLRELMTPESRHKRPIGFVHPEGE